MKNSEKFWLGFYIISLIIIGFLSLEALGVVMGLGSILTLCFLVDNRDAPIWVYLMPITWIMFVIFFIITGIIWLYEHTVVKFNKWMDKDKK